MNFDALKNIDYASVMQTLSSSLQSAMTAFSSPSFQRTTQELLSNISLTQAFTLSSIEQVTAALSSIPAHPYQRMLYDFFEPDHKFKTIDEVPEPDVVPIEESMKYIEAKAQEWNRTALHNLTCCPQEQIRAGFGYLSGGEVVYDVQKQKNYLEFFEMVRRIDPRSLNMGNINSISKKIIAEYLKVI